MANKDQRLEANTSRRTLLKGGAAVTGAAYVAPQILNTAVAGAQTTTCYAFKLDGNGGACQVLNAGPPVNDPSCDAPFNAAIAAAVGSSTLNTDCAAGNALINVISGLPAGQSTSATIEVVAPNCTIAFAGYKAGRNCVTNASPDVVISGGAKNVTLTSPQQDISHVTLVICCTGSP